MARTAALLLVVAGLTAACGEQECDVEDLVAGEIEGLDVIECGVHDLGWEDSSPLAGARTCVQAALDAGAAFYLLWRVPGFEGSTTQGWVGRRRDGAYRVVQYYQSADPTGRYTTSWNLCSSVRATTPCEGDQLRQDLCFECDEDWSRVLCDEHD